MVDGSHLPSPAPAEVFAPPPPDAPPRLHSLADCEHEAATSTYNKWQIDGMRVGSGSMLVNLHMYGVAAHYLSTHGAVDMSAVRSLSCQRP